MYKFRIRYYGTLRSAEELTHQDHNSRNGGKVSVMNHGKDRRHMPLSGACVCQSSK